MIAPASIDMDQPLLRKRWVQRRGGWFGLAALPRWHQHMRRPPRWSRCRLKIARGAAVRN